MQLGESKAKKSKGLACILTDPPGSPWIRMDSHGFAWIWHGSSMEMLASCSQGPPTMQG